MFICYVKEDATKAREIFEYLAAAGVDPWLDKQRLVLGDDWEQEIRKAVSKADAFVVCLRPGFDEIGFRQKEVRWARQALQLRPPGRRFIIPFIIEPCELPDWCRPFHAGSDLAKPTSLDELIKAVQKHYEREDSIRPTGFRADLRRDFFFVGCGLGNWIAVLPIPPAQDDGTALNEFLEAVDRIGLYADPAFAPVIELRDELASGSSPEPTGARKLKIQRFYDTIPQLRTTVCDNSSPNEFSWFTFGRLLYLVALTALWHEDSPPPEFRQDSILALESAIGTMEDLPSPLRQEVHTLIKNARQGRNPSKLYEQANNIAKAVYSLL